MKHIDHAEAAIRSIDTVLLEEAELFEALKEAVRYNSLEPSEAEQVLWDFRNQNGLGEVVETTVVVRDGLL